MADLFMLPTIVKLDAKRVDDQIEFVYEETFAEGQNAIVDRTLAIADLLVNEDVKAEAIADGLGIRLSGTKDVKSFGNMMLGEFLSWGTLGQMKLGDLLLGAMAGAAQTAAKSALDSLDLKPPT